MSTPSDVIAEMPAERGKEMAKVRKAIKAKLPKGYEYRVVNHSLVLLDVEANLIVDYMPNAIP